MSTPRRRTTARPPPPLKCRRRGDRPRVTLTIGGKWGGEVEVLSGMQRAGQEENRDERKKRGLTRQAVLASDTWCRPLRRSHAPCSSAMEIDSGFRRPVTSRGAAAPPPSPFRYEGAAPGDAQPPAPPTWFVFATAQTRRAAQTPFSPLHHPISQPLEARCRRLHGRLCHRQTPTAYAKTEGRRPHRHRPSPSYLPVPTTVCGDGSGSGLSAAESGSSRPSVAAITSVATVSYVPVHSHKEGGIQA